MTERVSVGLAVVRDQQQTGIESRVQASHERPLGQVRDGLDEQVAGLRASHSDGAQHRPGFGGHLADPVLEDVPQAGRELRVRSGIRLGDEELLR